jgi:hypothetical protein
MYEPVQRCTNCGANLTIDDLRLPNCRYCGTVLPHRAQAEQHAQLVGQVMGGLMAQQAQFRNAPYGPYADVNRIAAANIAAVVGVSRTITIVVSCIVLGVFLVVGVVLAVVFLG